MANYFPPAASGFPDQLFGVDLGGGEKKLYRAWCKNAQEVKQALDGGAASHNLHVMMLYASDADIAALPDAGDYVNMSSAKALWVADTTFKAFQYSYQSDQTTLMSKHETSATGCRVSEVRSTLMSIGGVLYHLDKATIRVTDTITRVDF